MGRRALGRPMLRGLAGSGSFRMCSFSLISLVLDDSNERGQKKIDPSSVSILC